MNLLNAPVESPVTADARLAPIGGDSAATIPLRLPRAARVAVVAAHHVRHDGMMLRGGAEKYICNTIRALLRHGAKVHVGYSGQSIYDDVLADPKCPARLTIERTEWLDKNLSGDRPMTPTRIWQRARWFERVRPDAALVVQQAHGTAFAATILGAALAGVPVAASVRQLPPDTPTTRRGRWRMRAVLSCCRRVVFNSARVAALHAERFDIPSAKIVVIPNAEPLAAQPRHAAPPQPRLFLRADRARRTMFGAVGQLSNTKGADLTLEAFARIAKSNWNAGLIFVGDGALTDTLRRRAAGLRIADRVTFAGFVDDHETALANIDIFVLPSRRESSSNAVLEAMARGLPCIVSDVGGLPELVEHGETGLVVPSENLDALESAMRDLCENPTRAADLGRRAYARAAEQFDPATVDAATVDAVVGHGAIRHHQ